MSHNHWLILHIAIAIGAILSSVFLPTAGGSAGGETFVFAASPTVEEYVREYFEETPILVQIAWCESRYRQYTPSGEIFRGEINSRDVGIMQINEFYHLETAQELGYNLYTLDGNLGYAAYLYEREGTVPWQPSSTCWKDEDHLAQK